MAPNTRIELKMRWSVNQLAKLIGETKQATRRALEQNGVKIHTKGMRFKGYVYLVDLQRMWPEAWLSILRIQELRDANGLRRRD